MSGKFSNRLELLRTKNGLSQSKLANKSGVAPAQISRYEAGRNIPSGVVIQRLANALGVSYSYLAHGTEGYTRRPDNDSRQILTDMLVIFSSINGSILVSEYMEEVFTGNAFVDQQLRSIILTYMKSFSESGILIIENPVTDESKITGLTPNGKVLLEALISMAK